MWLDPLFFGGVVLCGMTSFLYARTAPRARGWYVDVLSCRSTRKYERSEWGLRPSTPRGLPRPVRLADKARLKGVGKCYASILAASSHRQDGLGAMVLCLSSGEFAANIAKLGKCG